MGYISGDFDLQQATDYTLLARIGEGNHALAVIDSQSVLKYYACFGPETPEQGLLDVLNAGFGTVKLAVQSCQSVFVPADVFDEQHLQTYLRYLPADGVAVSKVTEVPRLGIKLVYQADAVDLEPHGNWPHQAVYPVVQPLLHSIANYAMDSAAPVIAIDIRPLRASICLIKQDNLLYSNDFELHSLADLNYYILQVVANFAITAEDNIRCCLSGEVNGDDAVYHLLSSSFSTIVLADSSKLTGITAPAELESETHRLLTLFGLNLCE